MVKTKHSCEECGNASICKFHDNYTEIRKTIFNTISDNAIPYAPFIITFECPYYKSKIITKGE